MRYEWYSIPMKNFSKNNANHSKNRSGNFKQKNHTSEKPTKVEIEGNLIILGRGGGIVKCDDLIKFPDGIRVYEENINQALHGDTVKVKVIQKRRDEIVGAITEILIRAKTEFTGTLVSEAGAYFLKPADPKMYTKILIAKHDLAGAKVGDRVYGSMDSWNKNSKFPEGKIIRALGVPGEHETEMQAIALERGFEEEFPEEVIDEAKKIDARGITADDLKNRRDFRNILTFTIDPYDAKDFDDAISYEKLENGDIEIGIHIADVSHYVQLETELDREALERGTSVYLVDRTIPMLPRVLSDDLCSLLPHVDRLTMSTVVTFNKDGNEKGKWFGKTIIHSAERFTYESAQEVLDGAPHKYKNELLDVAKIARKLGAARVASGALVLEQEEVKVIIDKNGKTEKIIKKVRTESHTLIEELMLLANKRVAEFLETGGKKKPVKSHPLQEEIAQQFPVIYRIHDAPSSEKTDDLIFFMNSIGHPVPVTAKGTIDIHALSEVLKKLENGDLKQTVLSYVIRSMSKAIYSTKNVGHYGLQFEHYAHFTSPIRRYPDLVAHRLLSYALAGNPAPASTVKKYERIARLCSMAEMRAADAERESVKLKLTEYMSERIGNIITGVITGVTEWGLYVRDKETTAEGLVGLRSMGGESFTLNPKLATLSGETSKRVFRIGDTINVRIVRADAERRQIDYELTT